MLGRVNQETQLELEIFVEKMLVSQTDLEWCNICLPEGNSDSNKIKLDLCFGGRRKFCGGTYVDFGKSSTIGLLIRWVHLPCPSIAPTESADMCKIVGLKE